MGLEDLAIFRSIPTSTVLFPSDAVSAEHCTALLAKHGGIGYLRTVRPKTPILYTGDEEFAIGGSATLKSSKNDDVTIVAAGVSVHEALKAYNDLKKKGITARVIDAYSIKPLDTKTLERAIRETRGIIVVEDHYEAGGLGEAVFSVTTPQYKAHLCVRDIPRSGKPEELMDLYGINASHIVAAAKRLTKSYS